MDLTPGHKAGDVEQFLRGMVQLMDMGNRKPPEGLKYRCMEEYVLAQGRHMGSRHPDSDQVPQGVMKECFKNCYELMHLNLTYCEGWATTGILPVLHAWLLDPDGRVIDPTWEVGLEYFGVEFPAEYVIGTVLARGAYGVIDNYQYRWPLLRGEEIR